MAALYRNLPNDVREETYGSKPLFEKLENRSSARRAAARESQRRRRLDPACLTEEAAAKRRQRADPEYAQSLPI